MKKKIVGFFICMLLIGTVASTIAISENNNILTHENCKCEITNKIGSSFGIMKEVPKFSDSAEMSPKPTVIDTPDYFNWMDFEGQDWTSPVKDQGSCGGCWLFAAIGALESIINVREGRADLDVDLSEQYVLSCLPRAGDCIGSTPFNAFFYIMSNRSTGNNCNGIIPESCLPYRAIDSNGFNGFDYDDDPVACTEKCENWEEYLIPISDFGKWKSDGSPEDIEALKTQIMLNGPVVTQIFVTQYPDGKDNFVFWGLTNHNPDDYMSSSEKYDIVNHCVVVVGWKDDPSIGNGGYWICKNSWGTVWGLKGFFNIEYGCLNIDSSLVMWVDYNPDVFVQWQPNADAGGIYYGNVGQEIIFDASGSFDHEGEIHSWEWDFGDGSSGYGEITNKEYNSEGVYYVTLNAIDNEGHIDNDTTWAFIGRSNDPPNTPTIKGPSKIKKNIEYNYTFSAIDPDGDDIYYTIFWGDYDPPLIWIGPFPSRKEISLSHTWIDKAAYYIHVKAKDRFDFESDWETHSVTMPKNKSNNFNLETLNWIFERFSNTFPILKNLLRLTSGWNYEK